MILKDYFPFDETTTTYNRLYNQVNKELIKYGKLVLTAYTDSAYNFKRVVLE